ncbi:YpmS family protein [Weissella cibaria]|uniref:YpmS family protein n=1 Tax=Weissella cibaria TaxID=137591 RepID=UPI00106E04FF|nr:YpmS family protein [Weissella cibaria]
MQRRKVTRFGFVMPNRDRVQGIITGVGATIVVMVLIVIGLLLLPQDRQQAVDSQSQLSQAAFEVSVDRTELNAIVEKYLNDDPSLKNKFHFEMTKTGMMVYGTYKLLGQNVDFGMKMTPEVTKHGGILLHADSVAVGQLPLPVKYAMGYIGNMMNLPDWLKINTSKQTILIDLGKTPKVNDMRFKAVTIEPAQNKFVFRGGFIR